MRTGVCLFIILLLNLWVLPVYGQDDPQAAFRASGLPVPRFASLKADKAYVRSGPGMQYPFEWVYQREGLPVEIVQEFDSWRKIRDADGGEGWINALLLSGRRMVSIRKGGVVEMRENEKPEARLIARLEPGVIAELRKCTENRCLVGAGGYSGWVERNFLWGIYDREEFN